jgi:hypothetical protein
MFRDVQQSAQLGELMLDAREQEALGTLKTLTRRHSHYPCSGNWGQVTSRSSNTPRERDVQRPLAASRRDRTTSIAAPVESSRTDDGSGVVAMIASLVIVARVPLFVPPI